MSILKNQIETIFERAKHEALALVVAESKPVHEPPATDGKFWISIEDFAKQVGVTVAGVMLWINREDAEHPLPCRKFGRSVYVVREEADAWAKAEAARERARVMQSKLRAVS